MKHLNTKSHTALSMSVVNRFCVKNTKLVPLCDLLKRNIDKYNKKFGLYEIICEWKLDFLDVSVYNKTNRMCDNERHHMIKNDIIVN